ncbi:MAG: phosphate ABC transporter permease [Candidatus Hadarchaeum yellowstonense]|jgi:phosphate transport system permease protein|uniref:Phosphate transport system permease protein PstA n=1 Tax=Hadarchaeum yellowstonense TaxID=1776334 RepID=A0A147JWT3_HADYE|nr:MAG: phosphate ABC transporter permease [Candidatus Hadarchaeum yellowstonense]
MNAKICQRLGFGAARIAILISLSIMGYLLFYIISNGAGIISWDFLTKPPTSGMTAGGIFPAIVGTLLLVTLAIAISLPLGLMSAIYLVEYSSRESRFVRLVNSAIYNLNGVPSIVFGLFGLAFFVKFLGFGTSLLSASLTLSLMILPTVIVTSVEALKSVPEHFREASLALGATKGQTIIKIVLPASFPGIITGAILGVGRAAGETAPILFTGAVFYMRGLPTSLLDPVMALPYHLFVLATEHPNISKVAPIQYGTALVLLILVLLISLTAAVIRYWYRSRRRW